MSTATQESPMKSISMRKMGLAATLAMMLLSVGCTTTRVNFNGPPNTVMMVDGKRYTLPAQIEMSRPAPGGTTKHDVALVTTVQSKELRAKGHINVFGYDETEADKLAVHTCNLDEAQLANIFSGNVMRFTGQTASRQPLYELMLGKE
jgi:hypothetical protein